MNIGSAPPLNLSLDALRGAVGEVVGGEGCWDRVVSIWRIFWALDRLIAVLWGIVHRLRADGMPVGLVEPAGAARDERPVVARVRRVRAVGCVRTVAARRVLMLAVGKADGMRRVARPGADVGWFGSNLGRESAVLGFGWRGFYRVGVVTSRNCVLIVPVC